MPLNSRQMMFCILFMSWWIVLVSGQTDLKHETFLDSEENVQLLWRVEDETIVFEVRAKTTGYVGIGLSSNGGMKGADIMIGWVKDGKPFISDRHGVSNEEPVIDFQDDYQLLYGSETDGLTIIGYQRKLLTCDIDDYDITSDTVRVIWAYHPKDPEDLIATYHGSQRRGVRSLMFMDLMSQNLKSLPDDVLTLDVLNDNIIVPSDTDTTYWCTYVELPTLSSPHQVIRIEPVIQAGNEGIVHHMILRECQGLQSITGSKSSDCGSGAMNGFKSCGKIILGWGVGGGTQEFPENVGYRFSDVKYIQLIVHYDNQNLIKGINDSSGIRLYHTPKLRQYDASVLLAGLDSRYLFMIPPKEEAFKVYGSCDTKCSEEKN
ncbi:DBH-like monooxygenase protein 1 homolog [Anneissia japonica]|uniref:DBH-like monooxygenase protein 1 homolog n=1 Tax=Anneissia japonica TaxID=1529436 RepID=UPI00142560EA|nr:DBH-like monooxygenase protein 1 homolog [Anneissia japonica]